ncbi:MAG: uL15 family ribosomal protein [Candidatus Undinarchaeales archaeon]
MSKKKKVRKHRGRKTGYGHKKKHRGAGSRGGRGKAGLQKHKKSWTQKNQPDRFGKSKMKRVSKKLDVINLDQINNMARKKSLKEISLKGYKVLGRGNLNKKLKISANSFSESALNKINEAGATAEVIGKGKEKIEKKKEAKKETKKPKSKK